MELPNTIKIQLSRPKTRSLELEIELPGLWVGVHVADEEKRAPVYWLSFAKKQDELAKAPKVLLGVEIGCGILALKEKSKRAKSAEQVRLIAMRQAIARVNAQWFTRAETIMSYVFWRVVEYDDCLMSQHEHLEHLWMLEMALGM